MTFLMGKYVEPAILSRYMGKWGMAAFLEHHQRRAA